LQADISLRSFQPAILRAATPLPFTRFRYARFLTSFRRCHFHYICFRPLFHYFRYIIFRDFSLLLAISILMLSFFRRMLFFSALLLFAPPPRQLHAFNSSPTTIII